MFIEQVPLWYTPRMESYYIWPVRFRGCFLFKQFMTGKHDLARLILWAEPLSWIMWCDELTSTCFFTAGMRRSYSDDLGCTLPQSPLPLLSRFPSQENAATFNLLLRSLLQVQFQVLHLGLPCLLHHLKTHGPFWFSCVSSPFQNLVNGELNMVHRDQTESTSSEKKCSKWFKSKHYVGKQNRWNKKKIKGI